MPDTLVPFVLTFELDRVKPLTVVPSMPSPALLWTFMLVSDVFDVLVSTMASPGVFWIVPPELSPPDDVLPLPVTVRWPLEPVLLSTMPLTAPLAEMSWNVMLLVPIVVLATLSAVPVVVVMLFAALVALTVPPLVALKPAWDVESMLRAPEKLTVAP